MKKIIQIIAVILVFSGGNIFAQTQVSGTISTNTTWSVANSPYLVTDDVVVSSNVALTIQAGVVVKFNDYYDDIWVDGSLLAEGTATSPIIFTALADDNHGGDTNGDGIDTEPEPNQWAGINLNATSSGNIINHCWFGYGGGQYSAMLNIFTTDATIQNNSFFHSGERGIYVENASPPISNNVFGDCTTDGIWFNGFDAEVPVNLMNNTFSRSSNDAGWAVYAQLSEETVSINLEGNSSTGLSRNGFGFTGSINGNVIYKGQSNFPFIVWDDVSVMEGAGLTFTPGTTVKFNEYYDDIWVGGSLVAEGTATSPIIFTALADDNHGGDTNGDGSDSEPEPNQWSGINLNATSSGNIINHCWFGYGGGQYTAMLNIFTTDASIQNNSFFHSAERGIYVENASPPISSNVFGDCTTEAIMFNGFDAEVPVNLINNTFSRSTNDGGWAVYAQLSEETVSINLEGNSSTGLSRNGFGFAGSITGNVTYKGQSSFPFIVWDDVSVMEGAGLTFTPGTTVKFNEYYDDIWVDGSLVAEGTATSPIIFTALADDIHGADTNGDGIDTEPEPNQWAGINLNATSSGNIINHCWFGYGGGQYSAMLNIFTTDASILNSSFFHSGERGIYVENASPTITNNVFGDCTTEAIMFNGFDAEVPVNLINNTFSRSSNDAGWAVYAQLSEETASINLEGNSSTGLSRNGFGFAGSITGNVIYKGQSNFPFIVWDDVSVMEGAGLTFTPGTAVKFNDYYDDLWISGSLVADGTATSPIIFTALADDFHGGDTNGDGSDSDPEPNQWAGINLNATSNGNIINHCWFGYGGGHYFAMLNIFTTDASIQNNSFFHSAERGIYVENASPLITNNVFGDCTTEAIMFNGFDAEVPVNLINNTFSRSTNDGGWAVYAQLSEETVSINLEGNSSTGLSRNGFGFAGSITGNVTYKGQSNFPFIVWEDVSVLEGAGLTFTPGTTVKFNDFYDDLWVGGSLVAEGTATSPIIFTALADDNHGGDTNGDGSDSDPEPNQWSGIHLNATSSGNMISHCWFGYGGGQYSAMLNANTNGINIQYCTFSYSGENGLLLDGASANVSYSIFDENMNCGIYTLNQALPVLSNNNIINNQNYGVFNADASVEVDARNNWWGDITGPLHPSINQGGLGNKVSDHVLFDPWKLQSVVGGATSIDNILAMDTPELRVFPNPVSELTEIHYLVSHAGHIRMSLYDTFGKQIRIMVDQEQIMGEYKAKLDCSNLASGIYFLRFHDSQRLSVEKVIVR